MMPFEDFGWIASLSHNDLQRLRASVRRVQMKHYPSRHINDHECDKIIASLGPEVAQNQIKMHVDAGIIAAKPFMDAGRPSLKTSTVILPGK